MATVTSKTSIKIDDLINQTVVSGHVTNGILILVTRGGAEIFAGPVGGDGGSGGGGGGGGAASVNMASPELVANVWSEPINHFLNTEYPNVLVWDASTKEVVEVDIREIDANSIQIRGTHTLPAAAYQIRIIGSGVAGDGGGSGGGSVGEHFDFPSPLDHWDCVHPFDTEYVSITTYDLLGERIYGDEKVLDNTTVRISFGSPQAGSALIQE